jgi:hypothetical protein
MLKCQRFQSTALAASGFANGKPLATGSNISRMMQLANGLFSGPYPQPKEHRGLVKGQTVPQDESSSESCPHCEINELVQEHIEGQEKVGVADLATNFEEAGTWYYVVDCATCKAVIPFKHAPEDEPILRFPTMRVRCFQCHTDHTYAADLVSHRKAAAPRGIFKKDRPLSHTCDGDREASRDRQEDRGAGDSGRRVILKCKIDPVSSSLRRDDIVMRLIPLTQVYLYVVGAARGAGWRFCEDCLA